MTGIDCALACPLPFWHVIRCLASPSFGLSLAILAFSLFWPVHCCFGLSYAVLACPLPFWACPCFGLSLDVLALCVHGFPAWLCSCCVFMVFLPGCVPRPVYPSGFAIIPTDSDLRFCCYAGWVKNYGHCPIFPFSHFKLE